MIEIVSIRVVRTGLQGHQEWTALDGKLTIFKRHGTYYARIRLASRKYVSRSLKTSNEAIAIALGRRLLFQMEQRAEQGLPPKSIFSEVIDDYVRYRERDHAHGKTSAGMEADHSCF